MKYFPNDCAGCPNHISWDLSIDDWTHICTKLHIQVDDMDCMSIKCPIDETIEDENYLKPCPYCGGEATILSKYYIKCKSCLAETKFCSTKELAIEAWNNRI